MMAFIALLASMLATGPYPTPSPFPALTPPPFPPNGTYRYDLYRGKKRVGRTTVVILRRGERSTIDLDESGSMGKIAIQLHGSLRYSDLLPSQWDVTYSGVRAAPFTVHHDRMVLDPPFMAGTFALPATLDARGEYVAWIAPTFGDDAAQMPVQSVPEKAAWSVAPSIDLCVRIDDAHIWYNPNTRVVDTASFEKTGVITYLRK